MRNQSRRVSVSGYHIIRSVRSMLLLTIMLVVATANTNAQSSGLEVELTAPTNLTVIPCSINAIEGVPYTGNLNDCVSGGAGLRVFAPTGAQTTPGGGTVTINADGSYTYIAPIGITSDTIPFTADDGSISVPLPGNVSVAVFPPLQTTNPTLTVPAGSTFTGNLNDYTIGGYGARVFGPVVTNAPTIGGGLLTIAPDGAFSYTAPGTMGLDTLNWSVDDDSVTVPVPGIISIIVGPAQPLATTSPTLNVPAGSTITGDLNLYVTGGGGPRVFGPVGTTATLDGGSVTINADGTFSYTAPLTTGADSFPWTVSDPSVSVPVPGVVNIVVTDPLATTSPTLNVPAGTTITGNLDDYVTGGDGPRTYGPVGTFATPGGGSVTINPNGTFTYTAPLIPGPDSFPWTVIDSSVVAPVPGTVNIEVTEPLSVTSPTLDVPAETTITGDLNDYVSGGDGPRTFGPIGTVTTPGGGSVTINEDGTFSYTAPTTVGPDSFPWTVIDPTVVTPLEALVNINVNQTEPLTTTDPTFEVPPGGTITCDLNDYVSGGYGVRQYGPLGTRPTDGGGTVTINADGTCQYTAPTTPGEDSFDWWVIDDSVDEPVPGDVNIVIIEPAPATPVVPPVKLPSTGQAPNGGSEGSLLLLSLVTMLLIAGGIETRRRLRQ